MRVEILISDKMEFKTKVIITGDKEEQYRMIKGSI